jgi:putative molybdopterin biosynthesis protein
MARARHPEFVSRVREMRLTAGVSQQGLAAQVGISRQALSALEAGRAIPGTDVALRLARALGCQVEALFVAPAPPSRVQARLANGSEVEPNDRVLLAAVKGGWVARSLPGRGPEFLQAADGVVVRAPGGRAEIELFGEPEATRERLVVMGCAPALGLLSARLAAGSRRVALSWVHGTSEQALEALQRGEVHLAGVHLRDARSGRFNQPQVQRRFSGRKMLIVNFAAWEQGLVVAPGNPLHIHSAEDLLRPRIRVVRREPGAGASKVLERLLDSIGAPSLTAPSLVAHGHLEVAQAVAHGAADAGIAIGSVALAWGLDFIPLSAERFDLVFPESLAGDARVERLIDELGSSSFRRELGSLGGYETRESGQVLDPHPARSRSR